MSADHPRRSRRNDRGQTIFVVPAAFLILLVLGTVTLEAAALHLRQRQLDDLADSAASDAVAVGFDQDAFRSGGVLRVDPDAAYDALPAGIDGSNVPDAIVTGLRVIDGPEPRVEVQLSLEHEWIIGRSLLGASTVLQATGRAELVPSIP